MTCPIDDAPLSVSSRDGVVIDVCPQDRGVGLDRGDDRDRGDGGRVRPRCSSLDDLFDVHVD
mgnify:CR=1 FL=1|jgi:Zn-finger nucleic acid-binding protein